MAIALRACHQLYVLLDFDVGRQEDQGSFFKDLRAFLDVLDGKVATSSPVYSARRVQRRHDLRARCCVLIVMPVW